MNKDLLAIFEYLEKEKGIKREIIINAIEESLRAAAKKGVYNAENIDVHINPKTADIEAYVQKTIVESVDDPQEEISLKNARELVPDCEIGQRLEISIPPEMLGRIAAQTARQIITQKLKGAERDVIYEEYRHRMGEIISGTVKQFFRGKNIIVDLGKVNAILPDRFYPKTEKYYIGDRVQALLLEVKDTDSGGAEVILSRTHPDFVKELFKQEVPEIEDGTVIIEKIVREAGYRTKMAVSSTDDKIDPVGTCVGVRGSRIKNIIRELNNEKIDIIPFAENPIDLLVNAFAPIEIQRMKEQSDEKLLIIVKDDDYPIALGKKGMNARLIANLIQKEIQIQKISDYQKLVSVQMAEIAESDNPRLDAPLKIEGVNSLLIESLVSAGYDTIRKILQAKPIDLAASVPGINYLDLADKIFEQMR